MYTRINSDKLAITVSATYQIWFRLPVPKPNPKTDPNPNPKRNNNVCSTKRHYNKVLCKLFPYGRGGFIKGL